jgi:hypothetical protein
MFLDKHYTVCCVTMHLVNCHSMTHGQLWCRVLQKTRIATVRQSRVLLSTWYPAYLDGINGDIMTSTVYGALFAASVCSVVCAFS